MGTFERTVTYVASRFRYIRKAFGDQKAPTPIRRDVPAVQLGQNNIANFFDDEEALQKILQVLSWIYADIELISRNVWATEFSVQKMRENKRMEKIPDHPFLDIYDNPNPFMTRAFVWQYTINWLYTSDRGAFLYLAPDTNNLNELAEIWPLNPNQLEPVKGDNFVDYWLYFPKGKDRKPFVIPNRNIVWLRFADKFDYWKSMPPLKVAYGPARVEMGVEETQNKIFSDSRGIPLTIVSLDKDLSEPAFESAKESIKQDWEKEGSTIAVTRAGQISTDSIGFSQSELQAMVAQEMSRNKIDSIFMGFPFRSDAFATGEGLKEMDKIIKEQTYRPLLIMLSFYMQQIVDTFYPDTGKASFADPRTYDRALNIQENMIYSRWRTINEQRAFEGEPPLIDPVGMGGLGDLPVMLGVNSSFVAALYGIGVEPESETTSGSDVREGEDPQEVGNLEDTQDPESMTNLLARGGEQDTGSEISVKQFSPAEKMGINTELRRWRIVTKRELREKGFATQRKFKSDIIPEIIREEIELGLDSTLTEEQADRLFDTWAFD